jgi:hypothetical protein
MCENYVNLQSPIKSPLGLLPSVTSLFHYFIFLSRPGAEVNVCLLLFSPGPPILLDDASSTSPPPGGVCRYDSSNVHTFLPVLYTLPFPPCREGHEQPKLASAQESHKPWPATGRENPVHHSPTAGTSRHLLSSHLRRAVARCRRATGKTQTRQQLPGSKVAKCEIRRDALPISWL